jgi:hypothetical protein
MLDEFWIRGTPLASVDGVEFYEGASQHLYYQGIRVTAERALKQGYPYRVNFTSGLSLSEDRTLASEYDANVRLAKAVLQAPSEIVEAFFDSGIELDYNWYSVEPGDEFVRVVLARIRAKRGVPSSARDAIEQHRESELKEAKEPEIPEDFDAMEEGAPASAAEADDTAVYRYARMVGEEIEALHAQVSYWRACAKALAAKVEALRQEDR